MAMRMKFKAVADFEKQPEEAKLKQSERNYYGVACNGFHAISTRALFRIEKVVDVGGRDA